MAVMHVVFAAVGAVVGATVEPGGGWYFGAAVGAFIGYAVAEFALLRADLLTLQKEVARLRKSLGRRDEEPPVRQEAAASSSPPDHVVPAESVPRAEPANRAEPDPRAEPAARVPSAAPAAQDISPRLALTAFDELRRASAARREDASDIPIVNAIRGFFTGGNALVRAGIIVLFFGVAFLLRYLTEHTHVPIEVRLAGVAVGGIVLLSLGWWLRKARPGYALALQGGGVGILYLTIFAALHLYDLLPPAFAFGVLAALAGLSAVLAVLQDSQAFALLAAIGGFLAPILASTGEGSHVMLFSYYAVLNAAIVAMAWFRAWRPLNVAGFLFTFVIGTAWGVFKYRPEDFPTTEPFLVLFFLFYVAVAVLFTLRQPANLRGYVDGTLVFGLPIIAFGLQSAMLHDQLFSLAYSAVAVSALYLVIAWLLHRGRNETRRTLIEAFVALGVAFLTLAVPLALDSHWNTGAWALEGSALMWIGCRQSRRLPRVVGAILIIAAGCVIAQDFDFSHGWVTLKLGAYFGVLTLSAAAMFAARTLQVYRERLEQYELVLGGGLFLWGLFWWLAGGSGEIAQWVPQPYERASLLGLAAATALGLSELHRRTRLAIAAATAVFLLPVMWLFAAEEAGNAPHPFAQGGWISWPLAFVIFYLVARRHEGAPAGGRAKALHVGAAWLLCALLSWETAWAVRLGVLGGDSWRAAAWAAWPLITVFGLPRLATRVTWPFGAHREAYLFTAGTGLAAYLGFWSLITNLALRGDGAPLPYAPLVNPLDIAQAFVFVAMVRYWRFLRAVRLKAFAGWDPRVVPAVFSALAFLWANAVLLRTLHQWGGVPFSIESFAGSTLTQTALSIFWAGLALSMMLVGARKSNRSVWLAGAALLAVVVAKLFLVDLSRVGSIERIVSFVGVGLLMLIVGYLSPLPPAVVRRQ